MKHRPNVLFIIADDHRFDAIRRFGDATVQTPVLDGLAAGGTAFRSKHIMGGLSAAVCVPSRTCLHTGAHVFRASVSNEVDRTQQLMTIRPELAVMPHTLRQAGYHTHAVGKWHNDKASFAKSFVSGESIFFGGMSDHHNVPVYDFDPTGQYPQEAAYTGSTFSTELFTDSAVQFIDNYNAEQPFFLYVAYTAPHDPRTAPQKYADMYDPEQMPLPANFMTEHPFDNGELVIRDEQLAASPRTPEEVRRHIADYYAMISHLDAEIGRVVEALKHSGQYDNTIIVYTADHGLAVGQHGLMGKQNMYEHSIRIPFIVHGPGIPKGNEVQSLSYQTDIFPTVCELTGTYVPEGLDGKSLLPLLNGEAVQHRESVFTVYKDVQRMVKKGDWKLIRYYKSPKSGAGSERVQLFHISVDPWELQDLSDDPAYAGQVRILLHELDVWQKEVNDPLAGV